MSGSPLNFVAPTGSRLCRRLSTGQGGLRCAALRYISINHTIILNRSCTPLPNPASYRLFHAIAAIRPAYPARLRRFVARCLAKRLERARFTAAFPDWPVRPHTPVYPSRSADSFAPGSRPSIMLNKGCTPSSIPHQSASKKARNPAYFRLIRFPGALWNYGFTSWQNQLPCYLVLLAQIPSINVGKRV